MDTENEEPTYHQRSINWFQVLCCLQVTKRYFSEYDKKFSGESCLVLRQIIERRLTGIETSPNVPWFKSGVWGRRDILLNCSENLFERCEKSFGHTVLLGPNNPLHFNRIPSQSSIKDSLDDIFEKRHNKSKRLLCDSCHNDKKYYPSTTLINNINNIFAPKTRWKCISP